MVCGTAKPWDGGDTDFQLRALGFANGIILGVGLSQNVDDQRVTVPFEKRFSEPGNVFHAYPVIVIIFLNFSGPVPAQQSLS